MMKIKAFVVLICFALTVAVSAQQSAYDASVHTMLTAAINGDLLTIQRLLKSGVYVNERDPFFTMMTPLMAAAQSGNVDTALFLLENGADPNQVDQLGRTPIALAARAGRYRAVKVLTDVGCDVNRADVFGKTPLMCAAARGCSVSIIYLFDAGADTMATCINGLLAKDYAKTSGNIEAIKLVAGISVRSDY
ncbi:MAG: ankyrin repeat domain-containing protein [Spirochaetales bacterium]|jgi:uncharacterized protein|nr:ankyrin repeat domain-containing protein [Spirochaetales bacterium]